MTMLLNPYRLRLAEFFDWYEDRLGTMFQVQGTVINGIGLLGAENIQTRFNYLQALSRFYGAAVMSDLPRMDSRTYSIIHQAAEHWSVTGEAFLVQSERGIRVVRPDYVFPISDPFDRETITRFLFVYPEQDTQHGSWENRVVSTTRANVIDYNVATGRATMAIRQYTAGVLEDEPRGREVDIGRVVWVKSGEPPYLAIESLVREISVRLNMLQLALNTTSIPIVQVDKDSLNDGALRGSRLDLRTFQQAINNPMGLTVVPPFGGEEGARYVERAGTGLTESIEYVRMLLGQLGVLSGVPDYVFGIQLGRPNNETERVLFAGQARVNAFRKNLEEALSAVGIRVHFASEPFVTRRERLSNILSQFTAGLITLNEAREALGYQAAAGPITPPPNSTTDSLDVANPS